MIFSQSCYNGCNRLSAIAPFFLVVGFLISADLFANNPSPSRKITFAVECFKKDQMDAGITWVKMALEESKSTKDYRKWAFKLSDYSAEAAAMCGEKAYAAGQKDIALTSSLAKWYRLSDNCQKAISLYSILISCDTMRADFFAERAECYANHAAEEEASFALALKDYEKAFSLNPHINRFYGRAIAKWKLGDLPGATTDLQRSITLNLEAGSCYNVLGLISHQSGDYDKAIMCFTKALDIDHNDSIAIFNRAKSHFENGSSEEACKDITESQRLFPDLYDQELIEETFPELHCGSK